MRSLLVTAIIQSSQPRLPHMHGRMKCVQLIFCVVLLKDQSEFCEHLRIYLCTHFRAMRLLYRMGFSPHRRTASQQKVIAHLDIVFRRGVGESTRSPFKGLLC